MLVDINKLKPNPFRDFVVDPIDLDNVATLAESIKEDGFWGGVVCRVNEQDQIEIAAGHHRIEAAKKAGIKKAEVFVGDDMDDKAMIRVYARENATQRGNHSTATAGSVAAAVRYIFKEQSLGAGKIPSASKFANKPETQSIGLPTILEFLEGVPGVNNNTVREQLANLKKSGSYARILREVQVEIEAVFAAEQEVIAKQIKAEEVARKKAEAEAERRAKDAIEAMERAQLRAEKAKEAADKAAIRSAEAARVAAEKRAAEEAKRREIQAEQMRVRQENLAAEREAIQGKRQKTIDAVDKANEQEVEFDFAAVATVFKNDSQVRTFRDIALSEGVKKYLPVANQAAIAQAIVAKLAEENKGAARPQEMTALFIRTWFHQALHGVKTTDKAQKKKQSQAEIDRLDRESKLANSQREFARSANSLARTGADIHDLLQTWPKNEPVQVSAEFKESFRKLQWAVGILKKHNLV